MNTQGRRLCIFPNKTIYIYIHIYIYIYIYIHIVYIHINMYEQIVEHNMFGFYYWVGLLHYLRCAPVPTLSVGSLASSATVVETFDIHDCYSLFCFKQSVRKAQHIAHVRSQLLQQCCCVVFRVLGDWRRVRSRHSRAVRYKSCTLIQDPYMVA